MCTWQVLSASEYLVPNKKIGDWEDPDFTYRVSHFTDGGHGLAFTWGPEEVCAKFKTKDHTCDYENSMKLDQEWCKENYGILPPELEAPVHGYNGKKEPEVCDDGELPCSLCSLCVLPVRSLCCASASCRSRASSPRLRVPVPVPLPVLPVLPAGALLYLCCHPNPN